MPRGLRPRKQIHSSAEKICILLLISARILVVNLKSSSMKVSSSVSDYMGREGE